MGKLIEDPTLVEIGKKYGKNGAQTALGKCSLLTPGELPKNIWLLTWL